MAIYHIAMGQALVLNNLVGNTIYTGPPPMDNALQSCAAVIVVDPAHGTGAMYHYPAGVFSGNVKAQAVMNTMLGLVHATVAWICYGVINHVGDPDAAAAQLAQRAQLTQRLDIAGIATVTAVPATSGAASVTLAQNNQVVISKEHLTCNVNLTSVPAGVLQYGRLIK